MSALLLLSSRTKEHKIKTKTNCLTNKNHEVTKRQQHGGLHSFIDHSLSEASSQGGKVKPVWAAYSTLSLVVLGQRKFFPARNKHNLLKLKTWSTLHFVSLSLSVEDLSHLDHKLCFRLGHYNSYLMIQPPLVRHRDRLINMTNMDPGSYSSSGLFGVPRQSLHY